MEFTGTVKFEPEDIGRMMGAMLSACPPDVRQQFINAAITAAPKMYAEFLKTSGYKIPDAATFDPLDPFGFWKNLRSPTKS